MGYYTGLSMVVGGCVVTGVFLAWGIVNYFASKGVIL